MQKCKKNLTAKILNGHSAKKVKAQNCENSKKAKLGKRSNRNLKKRSKCKKNQN